MMRVDDARIETTLRQLLLGRAAPPIRARIAQRIGLIKHATLSDAQKDTLGETARRLLRDAHADVRMEAMIQVENYVDRWIRQAEPFELQAEMAKAESLYTRALNHSPNSKQGNYRLGRFYLDSDRKEAGLDLLRRYGMLLDVPFLVGPPRSTAASTNRPGKKAPASTLSFNIRTITKPPCLPRQKLNCIWVIRQRRYLSVL